MQTLQADNHPRTLTYDPATADQRAILEERERHRGREELVGPDPDRHDLVVGRKVGREVDRLELRPQQVPLKGAVAEPVADARADGAHTRGEEDEEEERGHGFPPGSGRSGSGFGGGGRSISGLRGIGTASASRHCHAV